MALNNNAAQETEDIKVPGNEGGTGTVTVSSSDEMEAKGKALLAGMSEEERSLVGSKSGTLHFIHQLGFGSRPTTRKTKSGNIACSTNVGITFLTDEEIQVPQIDIKKDKDTGITQEDITYITVGAGQEFHVSLYEYMFLIIRPEYSGFCEAKGNDQGCFFSPKLAAWGRGGAKLPTPTINLKDGSSKENMVDIDQEVSPGVWEVLPGYEKFAPLLVKAKAVRTSGGKAKSKAVPKPTLIALAVQDLINSATK